MGDVCVWAFFALSAVYLLLRLPLTAVLVVRENSFGLGAGVFSYKGARRRAERNASAHRRPTQRKKLPMRLQKRLILFFMRNAKLSEIAVSGAICTHDAMQTALLTGAVWALAGAFGDKASVGVLPEFGCGQTDVLVCGMIRLRIGQNIFTAGKELIFGIRERYALWKSTRSKGL